MLIKGDHGVVSNNKNFNICLNKKQFLGNIKRYVLHVQTFWIDGDNWVVW